MLSVPFQLPALRLLIRWVTSSSRLHQAHCFLVSSHSSHEDVSSKKMKSSRSIQCSTLDCLHGTDVDDKRKQLSLFYIIQLKHNTNSLIQIPLRYKYRTSCNAHINLPPGSTLVQKNSTIIKLRTSVPHANVAIDSVRPSKARCYHPLERLHCP